MRPDMLWDDQYASVLQLEFNLLEAENSMKWQVLRQHEGRFDFNEADALVAFAQKHGHQVRGHVLAWHLFNPPWMSAYCHSAERTRDLLRDHMITVMQRYSGRIFAWDVVNEAIKEGDGTPCSSIWYDQPGIGFAGEGTRYIEEIFRWAREIDPLSLLFYNDNAFGIDRKSDAIYAMLRDFRRRSVPIDGIGIQMHLDLDTPFDSFQQNLERLADLDLEIHITELDVAIPCSELGVVRNPDDLLRQAEIYRDIAATCLRCRRCTAIQTWGVDDEHSWVPLFSQNLFGHALLFDRDYNRKPSYYALLQSLLEPAKCPRVPTRFRTDPFESGK